MKAEHVLKRFQDEVLKIGPETTLPSNLSDYWLTEIQQSIERCFDSLKESGQGKSEDMSLPLAAVVHILFAKNGGHPLEVLMEKMFQHFEDYRIELALEEVRRKTDFKTEPPTIASIFTDRKVVVSDLRM